MEKLLKGLREQPEPVGRSNVGPGVVTASQVQYAVSLLSVEMKRRALAHPLCHHRSSTPSTRRRAGEASPSFPHLSPNADLSSPPVAGPS